VSDHTEEDLAQKRRVITARTEALLFFRRYHVEVFTCCGQPLDPGSGECTHRPHHATPARESITGYPESYNKLGNYIEPIERVDGTVIPYEPPAKDIPIAHPMIVEEGGGFSVIFPSLPIAADGSTLEAAVREAVVALSEYATDWVDHLTEAPNHRLNEPLVEAVMSMTTRELEEWILQKAHWK